MQPGQHVFEPRNGLSGGGAVGDAQHRSLEDEFGKVAPPDAVVIQGVFLFHIPQRRHIGGHRKRRDGKLRRLAETQIIGISVHHAGFGEAESRVGAGLSGANVRGHFFEITAKILKRLPLCRALAVLDPDGHRCRIRHGFETAPVVGKTIAETRHEPAVERAGVAGEAIAVHHRYAVGGFKHIHQVGRVGIGAAALPEGVAYGAGEAFFHHAPGYAGAEVVAVQQKTQSGLRIAAQVLRRGGHFEGFPVRAGGQGRQRGVVLHGAGVQQKEDGGSEEFFHGNG